ncbi:MAG: RDD family protein [Oligoflexia bacterium]|nr:RDD family protein [Oligoflexia bacterium]
MTETDSGNQKEEKSQINSSEDVSDGPDVSEDDVSIERVEVAVKKVATAVPDGALAGRGDNERIYDKYDKQKKKKGRDAAVIHRSTDKKLNTISEIDDIDADKYYLSMIDLDEKRYFGIKNGLSFGRGEEDDTKRIEVIVEDEGDQKVQGQSLYCKFYVVNDLLYVLSLNSDYVNVNIRKLLRGQFCPVNYGDRIILDKKIMVVEKDRPLILEEERKVDHSYKKAKEAIQEEEVKKKLTFKEKLLIFYNVFLTNLVSVPKGLFEYFFDKISKIPRRLLLLPDKDFESDQTPFYLASAMRRITAIFIDILLILVCALPIEIILGKDLYSSINNHILNLFMQCYRIFFSWLAYLFLSLGLSLEGIFQKEVNKYLYFFFNSIPLSVAVPILLIFIPFIGTTLGQFLVGIDVNMFRFRDRILSLLRGMLGLFFCPFLVLDLPILLSIPSLKEIISRSVLWTKNSQCSQKSGPIKFSGINLLLLKMRSVRNNIFLFLVHIWRALIIVPISVKNKIAEKLLLLIKTIKLISKVLKIISIFLYLGKYRVEIASVERRLLAFFLDITLVGTLSYLLKLSGLKIILSLDYYLVKQLLTFYQAIFQLVIGDGFLSAKATTILWSGYSQLSLLILLLHIVLIPAILGGTVCQYILGIRTNKTNAAKKVGIRGVLQAAVRSGSRATIGCLLFPFVIFDLPLLWGMPSIKEIATRELLIRGKK